jgi:hypothetical protein
VMPVMNAVDLVILPPPLNCVHAVGNRDCVLLKSESVFICVLLNAGEKRHAR